MVLLYLLVWQLHVELLIVDPLGADDGLGVLVGFQLLGVAVELHKLVSRLQLGISRHFTWLQTFTSVSCKCLGLSLTQTHCAKVSWVAVLIGKSPKVSERQRGSPECNCVWRFCKSHTLLFVQHAINIVCNTCPTVKVTYQAPKLQQSTMVWLSEPPGFANVTPATKMLPPAASVWESRVR